MTVTEVSIVRSRRSFSRLVLHQISRRSRLPFAQQAESVLHARSRPVPVIFGSDSNTRTWPCGRIDEPVYYVPGMIAYGVIAATFSNIVVSVTGYREAGIYERRRPSPSQRARS